ncbi:MAG: AAA family ATPase [Prevotellaceae bacterium]|jgi:predicted AAA+ superfamily ATPase|nr:AAA family ATPase [Prevotellaceae bacterium]
MKRTALAALQAWKQQKRRKPLIIRGARQVGKTWLMKELARTSYESFVYLNFEENVVMQSLFTNDFDIRRILSTIRLFSGVNPEADKTLLIFDELQEAERGLTALKYFYENAPQYHVVAAGSMLGIALHPGAAFPVGKVELLDLYPLTFCEFLDALGETRFANLLQNRDWDIIKTFKTKLSELLKQYCFVGGMPEAVASFAVNRDFAEVRKIQQEILFAYEQDFSKHAPNELVPRIRLVWNSIPAQLAKENRKFVYGALKQGARAKEFELAIAWLTDCGLLHKVNRVAKPALPLKAYEDFSAFKLFFLDVGLLGAMAMLDAKALLEKIRIFEEFKGALTEQYVLQQLKASKDLSLYYWSAERSEGEIDLLAQHRNEIIPIEVKAAENLHAKSLAAFVKKYAPRRAVRASMSDYREEEWLTNLPLYAVEQLTAIG